MKLKSGSTQKERARVAAIHRYSEPDRASVIKGPDSEGEKILPIVGVGASAGGFEALKQVQALPEDTGIAFVPIQHLDARHESMVPKLLARMTPMAIAEVKQGTRVQPNHL
jgi:chemotaxis response regulator CheB